MTKRKYFTPEEKRAAKNRNQRRCNPGWYQRHKEEILKKSKSQSRTLRAKHTRLRYIANKKGHLISLSLEEYERIVEAQPCFYCGGPLNRVGHCLDRIDSGKGYTLDNVRPCCKRCNLAKNNMAEGEFREWVFRVFHHWASKELYVPDL